MLQTMHSAVSNYINAALACISSPGFDREALWAMAIGILFGLIILAMLIAFPGKNKIMAIVLVSSPRVQFEPNNRYFSWMNRGAIRYE